MNGKGPADITCLFSPSVVVADGSEAGDMMYALGEACRN